MDGSLARALWQTAKLPTNVYFFPAQNINPSLLKRVGGEGLWCFEGDLFWETLFKVHFHLFFFQWSSAILECKHHRNRQNLELRIWMPFFGSNLQRMYIPNITGAQQAGKLATACKTAQVIPTTYYQPGSWTAANTDKTVLNLRIFDRQEYQGQ